MTSDDGSRLIIKLFKQLIKREKKVNQIGYRLQLMYAWNRAGSERPVLLETARMPARSSL